MSVRYIISLNSYDRNCIIKAIQSISAHVFKAGNAFYENDEVTLELCLTVIVDRVKEIRNILYN